MMPTSKGSYGVVRHLTCLRWANVDTPLNPHYHVSMASGSHQDGEVYSHQWTISGLAHPVGCPVRGSGLAQGYRRKKKH